VVAGVHVSGDVFRLNFGHVAERSERPYFRGSQASQRMLLNYFVYTNLPSAGTSAGSAGLLNSILQDHPA
jgi:hypothetical protein